MAKLGDLVVNIGANTKDLNRKLGRVRRDMRSMTSNFKAVGQSMTRNLTMPLALIGGAAVKLTVDFESAMAQVQAVSGATAGEFKKLEQSAKDLGASTVFTAQEVAGLQLEYSRLGFSANEIIQVQEATLNLAQATGSDLAQAAEVAGATLRAFGMDASETGKVTDIMAASFSSSALDINTFQDSMKYVAPIAKAAGVSMEETSAMLAVLANSGIKGSQAGTALRRILQEMQGTTGTLTERFAELSAKGIGLEGAMDEVGRRAATSLLVLTEGAGQVDELTGAFQNSEGAAKSMADVMNNTAKGQLKAMTSALEGAGIALGEVLIPFVTDAANFIRELATKFRDLSVDTQTLIVKIAALVAGVGPLLIAVPQIIAAFSALSGPVGLVTVAIGGLALGIAKLVSRTNSFQEKSQTLKGALGEINKKIAEQSGEAKVLFGRLKDVNTSEDDRVKTVKRLQELYPDILKNLDKNATNLDAIEAAERRVITAIQDRVRAQILADAEAAKLKAEVELETRLTTAQITVATENPDIDQKDLQEHAQFIREEIQRFLSGEITGLQLEGSLASVSFGVNEASDLLSEELGLTDLNSVLGGALFSDLKEDLLDVIQTTKSLENVETILANIQAESGIEVLKDGEDQKVEDLLNKLMEFGNTATVVSDAAEDIEESGEDITEGLGDGTDAAAGSIAALTEKVNTLREAVENAAPGSEAQIDALAKWRVATDQLTLATKIFNSEQSNITTSVPAGSLADMREKLTKLREELELLVPGTDAFISKMAEMEELALRIQNATNTIQESLENTGTATRDFAQELQSGLQQAANSLINNMGQMIMGAEMGLEGILQPLASLAVKLGQLAIGYGTAVEGIKKAMKMNPIAAIVGGAALIALGLAMRANMQAMSQGTHNVPELAEGGIAFGPTTALIGDNKNARIDPEVVAPLSKLRDLLGNGSTNVYGRISGDDILISNDRATRDRNRYG